ncbi:MAG: terpene cyclase/mutase family protein [Planctomycetales bacterium]|nr:terpene cyclase/mutase family protein [Planctomycetales bacterium]
MRYASSDSTFDLDASLAHTTGQLSDPVLNPTTRPSSLDVEKAANAERVLSPMWRQAELPAWCVSAVAHGWLLVVLAVWVLKEHVALSPPELICSFSDPAADNEPLNVAVTFEQPTVVVKPAVRPTSPIVVDVPHPEVDLVDPSQADWLPRRPAPAPGLSPTKLLQPIAPTGGGLGGRVPGRRADLASRFGGTPESEAAVERGLRWLMAHQMPDGSWRFDHTKHAHCRGACRDPGTIGSSTASTALALLPFLGAGYTHETGEYQRTVQQGIYYLTGRAVETRRGVDLQEGTMYAQGLATIALCEAYSMTDDRLLASIAQPALDFIASAQHPEGGWRYYPGEPGDITSTGWQLMALRSGQLARLRVGSPTLLATSHFLDQVQEDYGAAYGYQTPGTESTTTAIGLLCRMYLGWPPSHAELVRGADRLANAGPSKNNMYFNYYAAQVLHHLNHRDWPAWNEELREHLIASQSLDGHEAGSWSFDDPKTNVAGRLFDTALATLNLEVYYRYLPLYGEDAVSADEF